MDRNAELALVSVGFWIVNSEYVFMEWSLQDIILLGERFFEHSLSSSIFIANHLSFLGLWDQTLQAE